MASSRGEPPPPFCASFSLGDVAFSWLGLLSCMCPWPGWSGDGSCSGTDGPVNKQFLIYASDKTDHLVTNTSSFSSLYVLLPSIDSVSSDNDKGLHWAIYSTPPPSVLAVELARRRRIIFSSLGTLERLLLQFPVWVRNRRNLHSLVLNSWAIYSDLTVFNSFSKVQYFLLFRNQDQSIWFLSYANCANTILKWNLISCVSPSMWN
jgi:hypothetical protein